MATAVTAGNVPVTAGTAADHGGHCAGHGFHSAGHSDPGDGGRTASPGSAAAAADAAAAITIPSQGLEVESPSSNCGASSGTRHVRHLGWPVQAMRWIVRAISHCRHCSGSGSYGWKCVGTPQSTTPRTGPGPTATAGQGSRFSTQPTRKPVLKDPALRRLLHDGEQGPAGWTQSAWTTLLAT